MAFPHYKEKGWLLKRRVHDGWEDMGEMQKKCTVHPNDQFKILREWEVHTYCNTTVHVGKTDAGRLFKFCPLCMVELTEEKKKNNSITKEL